MIKTVFFLFFLFVSVSEANFEKKDIINYILNKNQKNTEKAISQLVENMPKLQTFEKDVQKDIFISSLFYYFLNPESELLNLSTLKEKLLGYYSLLVTVAEMETGYGFKHSKTIFSVNPRYKLTDSKQPRAFGTFQITASTLGYTILEEILEDNNRFFLELFSHTKKENPLKLANQYHKEDILKKSLIFYKTNINSYKKRLEYFIKHKYKKMIIEKKDYDKFKKYMRMFKSDRDVEDFSLKIITLMKERTFQGIASLTILERKWKNLKESQKNLFYLFRNYNGSKVKIKSNNKRIEIREWYGKKATKLFKKMKKSYINFF